MEKKKTHKIRIVLIVIAALFLVVFLIPMPYSLTDGGSTGVCSLLGYGYDVRNCHELTRPGKEIDGVTYHYDPSPSKYNVGTRISVFGIVIFDNTHLDSPVAEHLKYEDEVKDIISYYTSHRVGDIELGSIHVSERESLRYVNLYFGKVDRIEVADEIAKVIMGYLDENPDSFLFDDFEVTVDAHHSQTIEKTLTSESWLVYEADYVISPSDKTVTELRLSPAMIPDTVPEGHDFIEVQKISFSLVRSVDEDKESVLRIMYPEAEIVSE